MAIAFDAQSGANQTSSTSTTWSHTCTGSDLILIVGVQVWTSDNISSVTYNGVSMTQLDKQQIPSNRWTYFYYLVNPATGANNVVATMTGSTFIAGSSASYTGVDQSTPIDTNTKNTATSASSLTTTVTTTAEDCWVVLTHANNFGGTTAGTNTTERFQADATISVYDSNASRSAGSNSLQVNGGSGNFSHIMAGLKPAVAAPVIKTMNTVAKANISTINTVS